MFIDPQALFEKALEGNNRKRVTMYVNEPDWGRIAKIAKSRQITQSQIVRAFMHQALSYYETTYGPIV